MPDPHQRRLFAELPEYDERHFARRSDPVTSREAAATAEPVRSKDAQAILDTLNSSSKPLAAQQIAERINRPAVAVSRRMAELVRTGLVQAVDTEYRTPSGRRAQRWAIT